MIRAVKLSTKFMTASKAKTVGAVLQRQRATVQKYIDEFWDKEAHLDKATLDSVPKGRLSARYRGIALNQALSIMSSTRKSGRALGKTPSRPRFNKGLMLPDHVAHVELDRQQPGSPFDVWVKLSVIRKGKPIWLPFKATKPLRKWLSRPGATLKTGCCLSERTLILWVDIPDLPTKATGADLGMDVGLNKLLACSDRKALGKGIKNICKKMARRVPGSRGKARTAKERSDYINHTLNQIPWASIRMLAIEKLKNLKLGKKPTRGKSFRKALAPWTYAYVLERAKLKAAENCVLVVEVSPAYTSQTCPECGHRARQSRNNERFSCVRCGHADDADFVGARNILAKALGEPMVPRPPVVPS